MFKFDNTYLSLPESFYSRVKAGWVPHPKLIAYNQDLANNVLGLNLELSDEELANIFTGQSMPEGAASIAAAYAGHQFGNFVPQLGDGRAMLLGEVVGINNQRFDIQLKGSGPTPYSRNGDGKSSLGPVIREYIVSEAMHYLGVPTTRALAAATTDEPVYREDALPGGVFTRVASSHLRIGTFEFFAARQNQDHLKSLADYAIARHYPEIDLKGPDKYLEFLDKVASAHAHMVSLWMSYGFIHGVMNTDNMSIAGETIDYGPCAFMDNFAFGRVFSSIDHAGRYAYQNQLPIARWNLSRLASCLISLVDDDQDRAIALLEDKLNQCADRYEEKSRKAMARKLGIFDATLEDDKLVREWLSLLEKGDLDFTNSFRALTDNESAFEEQSDFREFKQKWRSRLNEQTQSMEEALELMKSVNPIYIARNHQVEATIQDAIEGEFQKFHDMNDLLRKPFEKQPKFEAYKKAPQPCERINATFCGT